ncbi:hypothetical protein OK015_19390 [Mycobacterium sp. Aquia_216]|nr:hypothetical protein [Mycobacterium sp. Aquia_216]WAJ43363.1 hypothetical protein OK015_19390 [Mycobacterium sp. Aquia_216]
MGEDDTLWARSRSAGIDDLGDVVRVRILPPPNRPMWLVAQRGEVFEPPQSGCGPLDGCRDPVVVGVIGEDQAGDGVVDQVAQLLGSEAIVQWDNDDPDLERSDRRDDPFQTVVTDDADPVPGVERRSCQMQCGTVGPAIQRRVIDGVCAVEDDGGTVAGLPRPVAQPSVTSSVIACALRRGSGRGAASSGLERGCGHARKPYLSR